jgi:membrane protein YqaA with SNARE-associated domain
MHHSNPRRLFCEPPARLAGHRLPQAPIFVSSLSSQKIVSKQTELLLPPWPIAEHFFVMALITRTPIYGNVLGGFRLYLLRIFDA